ncbi:MAG: CooT family nickel-binding protein [Deltaproteobacteria bacterium]|jgi:predicted RNA-binding protein|nr:CooT family nickel-binding protein [Deltaproteobacteria bacterium]
MCESNIYVIPSGVEDDEDGELFLEAVDKLMPEGEDVWRVTSIFGEQKIINGRIKSMHLVDHKILFELR